MESNLTKRRPSLIPESPSTLLAGWTPSFDAVEEDAIDEENPEDIKTYPATTLSYLPSITDYETKPFLTIKKFQYQNPTSGQKITSSMAHTHGICVLNTEAEQIVACDYYNNRLLMFDSSTDGHLLEIFRGNLSAPECVAPRPNHPQQIYVTKPHAIALFDLEKKAIVQKLGSDSSGHANNRFSSPGGIAVDPDNGEIYMCDRWNQRICVFSSDFRYVNRRWYLTRWQQTQNKVNPSFVAINGNNQCLVTCDDVPSYRGAVYVFDKMGYIQKIYDQESKNTPPNVEAKLIVPHGILLDDQGNWLTMCYSDTEARSVQRRVNTDENGESETINYWRCKDLKGPSGIAIKRDKTIIIGDRDDNAICFFKQAAKKTTTTAAVA